MAGRRAEKSPKEDRQLFSLRLPRPLWTQLGLLARVRGQKLNELIVEVLQQHWETVPERSAVEKLIRASSRASDSSGQSGGA